MKKLILEMIALYLIVIVIDSYENCNGVLDYFKTWQIYALVISQNIHAASKNV